VSNRVRAVGALMFSLPARLYRSPGAVKLITICLGCREPEYHADWRVKTTQQPRALYFGLRSKPVGT
jgi:hypothetical protein